MNAHDIVLIAEGYIQCVRCYWISILRHRICAMAEEMNNALTPISNQMVNAMLHVIRSVSVYGVLWNERMKIKDVAPSCTKQKNYTQTCSGTDPFIKKILHAVQLWSLCRHNAVHNLLTVGVHIHAYGAVASVRPMCSCVFIETERFSRFQFYFSSVCANSVTCERESERETEEKMLKVGKHYDKYVNSSNKTATTISPTHMRTARRPNGEWERNDAFALKWTGSNIQRT